ncbi:MAG: ABC transporter ATP-binding protein [Lachnospiraceae bacterium]|nr:ABC transporter ATP-binding protein [Lachnospiraceae bacterium]
MSEAIIQADNLVKIYKTKDIEVVALQGLDLTVNKGELMAIIGSSGSGKSTFLNMIGGLDKPSAGKLYVDGKNLFQMSEKELVDYKRQDVGFVWQNNGRNLLPYLSAFDNIMMPMELNSFKEKKERAEMLLDMVGLSHKKNNRMQEMSGGEQQRIAIAIALANSPKVLLADEPTGSVDTKTSNYIFDIFRRFNEELGVTIVIVTHDVGLSKKVQRVAAIRDGKISSERILKEDFQERVKNHGKEGFDWHEADSQDEFAILDRAGRIQLPHEALAELGLKDNKVRIVVKDGKVLLENPEG